jgi:hypothetical protein
VSFSSYRFSHCTGPLHCVFVYNNTYMFKARKKHSLSRGKTVPVDLFLLKMRALSDFQVIQVNIAQRT